ncbi:MAG: DUF1499 domain-containing protein [Brevibacterium sp.]|nr:DUF1499 domain-containing protein [Brevibacterium sp.]MDN5834589.1 DUF1499 domain-containing protein [Brevibacterium sp.]MDN5877397.1 DUF1499 domain-containing protein [Brevibacterium sp.]MDN5910549.1 DUF1499 domain-containing protein [Brevibacterium sp.]MDN6134432.1 DUF1499 domain-containing protein [Brevibacterium sp.]
MGASYEETMTVPIAAPDVGQRAFEVLRNLQGAAGSIATTQPGVLSASFKATWRSWGEKITVHIDQASDGTVVRIRSAYAFPLQVFDWGVNRGNVQRIRAGLELPARSEGSRS